MSSIKTKIDIIISTFDDLGAQRVAVNVANGLVDFYDINFIVFKKIGPFESYLNKNIKIIELDQKIINLPKIKVLFRILAYYRLQKERKTDISISFSPITNIVILLAKIFNHKLKTIIQEHAYPSLALKDRENTSFFFEFFYKFIGFRLYNKTDIFITITNAIKNDFIKNFGIEERLFEIVRNPVDIEGISFKAVEKINDFNFLPEKKYLIGVGRLSEQKNFKRLIDIFINVKKEISEVELIILGEGDLKKELFDYCKDNGVDKFVHMLGFKKNPYKYIAKANCFCLSSNWEGLPQVIAEAMICRTLVVANDCPSGPSEMIQNEFTGFLIPLNNNEKFKDAIILSLKDFENNKKIIDEAYHFANSEYSINKCMTSYQNIINSLMYRK